ncbi:3-deoxy-manno-octulosonate cytidylyltransferase [Mesorhizobium sp. BAC0120]|uniref:3-deoxy-manno-octulosonate cytidylyltransferase n=1 Tax=Mesorhizobium sp. BAC0120 TaxID=3090670 RepID=UPI00298D08B0|nr:3-deoxy-manno-octulosonate cytidylyltransferase [Mesorhizobium sp. BAC0120]MDW6024610.1 3-deoxy-manno-octulosonate cytidylyltransferase [Mesorhizobium sp. BAC0120]
MPLDSPVGAAKPSAGATAGLSTTEDWRSFFASYSTIVLVANSDEVDIEALRAALPRDALFVFFNKVYKVLKRPFDGHALLAVRSGTAGVKILNRGELGDVVSYFPADRFLGILSIRAGSEEKVTPASAFGSVPAGLLDLTDHFRDFYPSDHLPSTGFALAVWLCELVPDRKTVLAGFSGKRSDRLQIFHIHDWTFEQTVQRLLVRSGRLTIANAEHPSSYAALTKRFPEITEADISLAAAEILSERLEGANMEIDKLISMMRVNRSIKNFFGGLRPVIRSVRPIETAVRRLKGGMKGKPRGD